MADANPNPAAPATPAAPAPSTPAAPAAPASSTPPAPAAQPGGPDPSGGSILGTPGQPPAGTPNGNPPAPAVIDVQIPEGMQLEEASLAKYKAFAKEMNLNGEQASKILEFQHAINVESEKAFEVTQANWLKEVQNHPEFGGEKYATTVANARRAFDVFGKEAREAVTALGLENHPGFVMFAARVGQALGEDGSGTGRLGGGQLTDKEQQLRNDYPSMYKPDGTPAWK